MDNTSQINEFILKLIDNVDDKDKEELERIILSTLPKEDAVNFRDIATGKKLPPLSSDIVAKRIFDPDEHPQRLELLLRHCFNDSNMEVEGSMKNEGQMDSIFSKRVVFDIPSKLVGGARSDVEMQIAAQNMVLIRGELYASDFLLIQYSVDEGQKKESVTYENIKPVFLLFLMKESPRIFKEHDSDDYIHKFSENKADSGLTYKPLCQTTYVQLDKCYKQFTECENPSRIDTLFAALYDINNEKVQAFMEKDNMLSSILADVQKMGREKEVRIMLLAEKYANADLNAVKSHERAEARRDDIAALLSGGLPEERIKECLKATEKEMSEAKKLLSTAN